MTAGTDEAERGLPATLAALTRSAGMTQEQLAEAAGLSPRTVGNLERGRVMPHRQTMSRLMAALGPEATRELTSPAEATGGAATLGTAAGTEPFTGRDAELAMLDDVAAAAMTADGRCVGPAVVVISGPAGAGKTRLAIRAAHRVAAAHGAEGHLLDLRGRHRLAVAPGTALGHLLHALGVPESRMPWPVLERTNVLRAVMAGRRGVLVLDDAAAEDQVRPLLPASTGWLVIVTSRGGLAGLFGARWCHLDPLPGAPPTTSGATLDETYRRLRPEARHLFSAGSRCCPRATTRSRSRRTSPDSPRPTPRPPSTRSSKPACWPTPPVQAGSGCTPRRTGTPPGRYGSPSAPDRGRIRPAAAAADPAGGPHHLSGMRCWERGAYNAQPGGRGGEPRPCHHEGPGHELPLTRALVFERHARAHRPPRKDSP